MANNQNNLKPLSTEKARQIGAKGRKKFGYSKTQKEIYKRAIGNADAIRYE